MAFSRTKSTQKTQTLKRKFLKTITYRPKCFFSKAVGSTNPGTAGGKSVRGRNTKHRQGRSFHHCCRCLPLMTMVMKDLLSRRSCNSSFIEKINFLKKDFILHSHDWKCLNFFLTDECVADHSERIRSIQIDKNFITQTFRIYNFIISRTVRKE